MFMSQIQSREAHQKKGTGEGRKREKRTEREGRREGREEGSRRRGGEGAESCPIEGKKKENKIKFRPFVISFFIQSS